jgi:hypothetical protein
LLQSEGRSIS